MMKKSAHIAQARSSSSTPDTLRELLLHVFEQNRLVLLTSAEYADPQ